MAVTLISYTMSLALVAPWLIGSAVSSPVRTLQTPANLLQTSGVITNHLLHHLQNTICTDVRLS